MAIKKKNIKFSKWVDIPPRDLRGWLSDYIVSSMILKAYNKKDRLPARIRFPDPCIKSRRDGSGLISFEVQY